MVRRADRVRASRAVWIGGQHRDRRAALHAVSGVRGAPAGARQAGCARAIGFGLVIVAGTFAFIALFGSALGAPAFGRIDFSEPSFITQVNAIADRIGSARITHVPLPMPSVFLAAVVQGTVAGFTVNLPFAFGEELGWRGLLLTETRRLGLLKSTLLIGAIWGIWHAPIVVQGHNYPDHPIAGVLMMIAFTHVAGQSAVTPAELSEMNPFLEHLLAMAADGHTVVVFEGHATAIGRACHPALRYRGFHPTGAVAVFGATMAAGAGRRDILKAARAAAVDSAGAHGGDRGRGDAHGVFHP